MKQSHGAVLINKHDEVLSSINNFHVVDVVERIPAMTLFWHEKLWVNTSHGMTY